MNLIGYRYDFNYGNYCEFEGLSPAISLDRQTKTWPLFEHSPSLTVEL